MPASFATPLEALHLDLGAKLVPFGGWMMPIAYPDGTVAEHRACREEAVIFDVSHLGTVRLDGPSAFEVLQQAFTNDLAKIHPGRAQYTHLLDDAASVVDDIIVWWVGADRFDVMPNASNTAGVRNAIGGTDVTHERAILAIQGPQARLRLSSFAPEVTEVGRFDVVELLVDGVPVVVAGTGYTGEDGLEVAIPAEAAEGFFRQALGAGITPAGLGARDTLRLEAALPLHGHELGEGITPLQANLGWVVGWDKPAFAGRDALLAERAAGVRRRLTGFITDSRQPPREGAEIVVAGEVVGTLTSGNFSPMLGCGIALGFVDAGTALEVGDEATLLVRSRPLEARRAPLPFWPQKGR